MRLSFFQDFVLFLFCFSIPGINFVRATSECYGVSETRFVCVLGQSDQYLECDPPGDENWRDCPEGTSCTGSYTLTADYPCVAISSWTSTKPVRTDVSSESSSQEVTNSTHTSALTRPKWLTKPWTLMGLAGAAFVVILCGWLGSLWWPFLWERAMQKQPIGQERGSVV